MKAVIFDMDNTLFDFVEAKSEACKHVAGLLSRDDADELLRYFFRGVHNIEDPANIRDYLVDRNIFSEDVYVKCVDMYEICKLRAVRLYPGVRDVLAEIRDRGLKVGLVTDACREKAVARLEKVGILHCFDAIVTFDDTGRKKPDTAAFSLCLKTLGVEPGEAALVGDSLRRDIAPGKELGMLTVHARYGDRNFHEAGGGAADTAIDSATDLLDILFG